MKLGFVLGNIPQIDLRIDLGRRARRVDRSQDVQNRSSVAGSPELGRREHALLDTHTALTAVVRVFQGGVIQVEGQTLEMVDHVGRCRVEFRPLWPDVRVFTLFDGRPIRVFDGWLAA